MDKLTEINRICNDQGYDYEIAVKTYFRDGTPWYVARGK